ncbi:MAG: MATE family efflux transporter [Spirochaetaceae bacterium]|jgi:putative MATE family efflux protein|nr:MATE family efflux transporter [Spirochaetaceae bacterium]
MDKNPAENIMGTAPVNRLLLSMSIPMMLSMMAQAFYNVVDSIFVSQVGANALTAVTLAFPVQMLMMGIGTGTGVGINALLSKSLGEKNPEMAQKSAVNGMFLIWISAAVFTVAGAFLSRWYFRVQTDIEEIVSMGGDYLFIVTVFSLGVFHQVTFERLLASTGKTFYAMVSQLGGTLINLILDPILIFGFFGCPALGTRGAAIATVIGQFAAAGIGLYLHQTRNKEISMSFRRFKPQSGIIKQIYGIGLASILMQSTGSIMNYGMNIILIAFTPVAAAVFGVFFKLQSFLFMPVFGLNNAMIPIIAYNYGARSKARIVSTIKLGVFYAAIIMVIGLSLFQLIPDKLLLMFNADAEMLAIGVPALHILSIIYIFAGAGLVGVSVFQALGSGLASLLVGIGRQLVVLLPAAYLLSLTGSVRAVWWSSPIAELATAVLCTVFFLGIYRQKIKPL